MISASFNPNLEDQGCLVLPGNVDGPNARRAERVFLVKENVVCFFRHFHS